MNTYQVTEEDPRYPRSEWITRRLRASSAKDAEAAFRKKHCPSKKSQVTVILKFRGG